MRAKIFILFVFALLLPALSLGQNADAQKDTTGIELVQCINGCEGYTLTSIPSQDDTDKIGAVIFFKHSGECTGEFSVSGGYPVTLDYGSGPQTFLPEKERVFHGHCLIIVWLTPFDNSAVG